MSIHEIPEPPNIKLGDLLLNVLSTEAEDILKSNYVTDKEIEDKTNDQIEDEYNYDQIKDAFTKGQIPSQLEFFFSGDNDNFVNASNFLSLNEDNNEFVSFLRSDIMKDIMAKYNDK